MSYTCKGCGKPIVFAKTHEGKTIPLEKMTHTYELDWNNDDRNFVAHKMTREIYQSHFITCPKREQFSRRNA